MLLLRSSETRSKLYGLSSSGGSSGRGTIFSYDTKARGNDFTLLHAFDFSDGACPYGSLTVLSGILYGMTNQGGPNNNGVIFSYNPSSNQGP